MDQKRYDIGLAKRRKVLGDGYVDRALQNVDDFNRDFQRLLTEYCWGETWGDETLKPRERSILNLGMIAALGKMEEFQTHVRGALNNGLTPNEIRAALTQITIYCGAPIGRSTRIANCIPSSAGSSKADLPKTRGALSFSPTSSMARVADTTFRSRSGRWRPRRGSMPLAWDGRSRKSATPGCTRSPIRSPQWS